MKASAIKHYRLIAALLLCAAVHGAFTFACALTRLYTYKTSLLDLGVFNQLLWNGLHHFTFTTTATWPYASQPWLGFHFSPILFLLLPLYAASPRPETLQAVQSALIAVAALPLYAALLKSTGRPWLALAGIALYWLNPLVLAASIWDFHEVAFAVFFIALALWALAARRFTALCLALFPLLLTKEHYGLSVAGFGLLWGWRTGEWRGAFLLMAAGLISVPVIVLGLMPWQGGSAHHAMLDSGLSVVARYGWLSGSWSERAGMLRRLLLDSGGGNNPGCLYLVFLLLGGLLLPLAAPVYLAAGSADLAANLLSANPMQRHINAYHGAALIPVMIFAAAQGYQVLEGWKWLPEKARHGVLFLLAALALHLDYDLNPLRFWELEKPVLHADRPAIQAVRRHLPAGPLCAQSNIGVFFSERTEIFPFPEGLERANAVVLHLANPYADTGLERFNTPFGEPVKAYMKALRALLAQPDWHIAYRQPPWLVLQRGAATEDERPARADIMEQVHAMEGRP